MAQNHDGLIWVGLDRGGLLSLQPRRIQHLGRGEGLPDDNAWTLRQQKDGAFWVGTDRGAARIATEGSLVLDEACGLSRNQVRAFAEDRDGRIWIGTVAGLEVWMADAFNPSASPANGIRRRYDVWRRPRTGRCGWEPPRDCIESIKGTRIPG